MGSLKISGAHSLGQALDYLWRLLVLPTAGIPGRLENRHFGSHMRSRPFSTHFVPLPVVWSPAFRVSSLLQLTSPMVPWPAAVSWHCAPRSSPIPQTWPLNGIPVLASIISQNTLFNNLLDFKHTVPLFSIPSPSPQSCPSQCLPCTVELTVFCIWKAYNKQCRGRVRLLSSLK